ncbi:DUF262 domain-containing protein [Brevundimonas naejangsanensis]|uniref:DUF262 domain-containing protein n=1 Tax=Brevundimonas naejangsanensis TaxID=588932 RepID=UPI0039F6F6E8
MGSLTLATRTKLTNSSDESEVSGLLSGDLIYEIPYFQRPYKWKPDRLRKLEKDILDIVDGSTDSHFLGAIIMHGRRSNPSQPTNYELIDGQQRITTVFLYICACIKILQMQGQLEDAASLFQKFIALGRTTSLISNVKLQSCGEDRQQMNVVMSDLTSDVAFRNKLGSYAPQPLPSTGKNNGQLLKNYKSAVRFVEAQFKEAGLDRVHEIYNSLLSKMSVVQIDVWDPTNGPKIFDSLNSSQEPMTIGDLVRNDVFSRIAGAPPQDIERIDRDNWQPFYHRFHIGEKNYFEGYFFPFGLIHNPNLTKSGAYDYLRGRWKDVNNPVDVVSDLAVYQNAYIDLVTGKNHQGHSPVVAAAIRRFTTIKAPSSTYPFLMRLSEETRIGAVKEEAALKALALVEAFLVRRAIVGYEPTGLHAVFKSLWADANGDVTPASLVAAIKTHRTVIWPTDDQIREAIKTRDLYNSQVISYLLREYDASYGGDFPSDIPWIEHILPQANTDYWRSCFTDKQHNDFLHTIANLLPLSSKMNRDISNKPYPEKKEAFENDSMFKSAREFAKTYSAWGPTEMQTRAENLAVWANERWPDA